MTGKPQRIVIEYFEIDRWAWLTLRWNAVGAGVESPALIPTEAFFPDEASAQAKRSRKRNTTTGLLAEYFDVKFKKRLGVEQVHRAEAVWENQAPLPGLPVDAGARYTGYLVPPTTGQYKFVAFGDDRLNVSIDQMPLLEAHVKNGRSSAFMELQANTAYPLLIEHADTGYWGSYYLHWIPPGSEVEVSIPYECLFPDKRSLPKDIEKH